MKKKERKKKEEKEGNRRNEELKVNPWEKNTEKIHQIRKEERKKND